MAVYIAPQGSISKPHIPIQCWAHSKTGNRCCKFITSREGEPIPIPYCDMHLDAGDGALRRVSHPFAGSCLIANFDLPKNYRMVLWGYRGKCNSSDKEDRSVSFYPPNPVTGRNYFPFTKMLKTDNYNGVINPTDTGDLLQFASCPGPTERQNMRYVAVAKVLMIQFMHPSHNAFFLDRLSSTLDCEMAPLEPWNTSPWSPLPRILKFASGMVLAGGVLVRSSDATSVPRSIQLQSDK